MFEVLFGILVAVGDFLALTSARLFWAVFILMVIVAAIAAAAAW